MLKVLLTLFGLLILGGAGFVVYREEGKARARRSVPQPHARITTISTGERVDLAAHTAGDDLVVVEFTANF